MGVRNNSHSSRWCHEACSVLSRSLIVEESLLLELELNTCISVTHSALQLHERVSLHMDA